MNRQHPEPDRSRYEAGLPDHHDPTAGIGGAAPAYSALSVRLVLAGVALILALGVGLLGVVLGLPWLYLAMAVLVIILLIDAVVIIRRKRRGEPG